MEDRPLVIDASVIVKWFHDEELTPAAITLQDKINAGAVTAYIPDLALYEVANVLVRGIGEEQATINRALEILATMPWSIIPPTVHLLREAIALAATHSRLSVYDATYVILALQQHAKLITADRKLYRAVNLPSVFLLE